MLGSTSESGTHLVVARSRSRSARITSLQSWSASRPLPLPAACRLRGRALQQFSSAVPLHTSRRYSEGSAEKLCQLGRSPSVGLWFPATARGIPAMPLGRAVGLSEGAKHLCCIGYPLSSE